MSGADTHRYHLRVDPLDAEVASAHLWAAGALGVLEQPDELVAWFGSPDVTAVPPGGRWEVEPDHDWQAAWKADLHPVRAGRFVIVPTWCVEQHRPAPDDTTVVLDPGRAFGSGHHATTLLCLEELDGLDLSGTTVADVGCGSGILAIAAADRGARVVAVDIDPEATAVTAENAQRNGVSLDIRTGSVDRLDGPADVVVANLVTDVIVGLAPALVAATGATLIVSGIAGER